MNPFANWTAEDVRRFNERTAMKTAQQHNAEVCGTAYSTMKLGCPECGCQTGHKILCRTGNAKANAYQKGLSKRVRQSSKPKLNRLESEFYERIKRELPGLEIRNHSLTFKLANGVNYTPDFTCASHPPAKMTAWEVKGKHSWDDAIVKIKVAAHEWPEVRWILAWKQDGKWQEQVILP